jgi:hypothetical protein
MPGSPAAVGAGVEVDVRQRVQHLEDALRGAAGGGEPDDS